MLDRTTKVAQKLKVLPEQPEPVTQSSILSPVDNTETGSGEPDDDQSEDDGDDEAGFEEDGIEVTSNYLLVAHTDSCP